ncbi:4Fe-4S binding protein [Adhaeribacter sp. BT258]|uniref:4Fe-4S binding protein n=1 Tax=Adhaeribacter terrigena TaxID=2793070 RepID=A0ABS1BZB5_9BACT|nr:4Fe-4S binding protein [Adhaeribacter terrigena]MBK0402450.1 4Fe-4S binding protein [Adhaeribacter terrigena]
MFFEPKTQVSKPSVRPASLLLLLSLGLLGIGVFTPERIPFLNEAGFFLFISSGLWLIFKRFKKTNAANLQHQTWFRNLASRGIAAWLLGVVLTGFYVVLYWFPHTLEFLIREFDGLSQLLRNKKADQWFLYGAFYTLAVIIMGIRALLKYRHSKHHLLRTSVNIFFQLVFAFLLPHILVFFNQPEFYFSYFWPLKFEYLFPDTIHHILAHPGGLPVFMIFWSVLLSFVVTPVLTYFWGKRWYCSWVCGCGALAETAGDPFRHLSDKSRKAWQLEVAIVYPVLGFVIVTTALLWLNSYLQGGLLGSLSGGFARSYGFFIGIIFSGVIGVGFYPIFGSRVWCRFGCPMAAYLGLLQKHFSRFRITTNGGQCISCGNCSTYCEMGIDVKQYAQQGKPIIRAACVGCGMCATVCPRGVLKLENKKPENRHAPTPFFHAENLRILE